METRGNGVEAPPLSSKKDAYNTKLAPKYLGPLKVRKIISPVIIDLRNAKGKWHRHIHVQDLKPATTDGVNKNLPAKTRQGDRTKLMSTTR